MALSCSKTFIAHFFAAIKVFFVCSEKEYHRRYCTGFLQYRPQTEVKMEYFNQDAESVIKELGSDRVNGLTEEQVKESREKYGENVLSEEKQKSIFMVFLEQFADLLVAILIAASIISMISGEVGSTIVILVVLIMNAILGTVQHVKAQRSLASLKAMSSPNARVIRGGVQTEIPASEVVVGDILLIEAEHYCFRPQIPIV